MKLHMNLKLENCELELDSHKYYELMCTCEGNYYLRKSLDDEPYGELGDLISLTKNEFRKVFNFLNSCVGDYNADN